MSTLVAPVRAAPFARSVWRRCRWPGGACWRLRLAGHAAPASPSNRRWRPGRVTMLAPAAPPGWRAQSGPALALALARTLPLLLLLALCGREAAAESLEPRARSSLAAPHGALYRVARDGELSYLFGTVHVGDDDPEPLAPAVRDALAGARNLVLELDPRDEAPYRQAVLAYGSYAAGDAIGQHISADTLAKLTLALHAVGIPVHSVAGLKPWLIANLLLGLELDRHGFQRRRGSEFALLASAQDKAVVALESAAYQLALFDTLGTADAERYLRENLADLADGTSLKKAHATIDAWYGGERMDALLRAVTDGDSVTAAFTRRMLLDKRNPDMAAHIAQLMRGGTVNFVGVGLLHLLGPGGLPALLTQRGYRVDRIY